MMQAIQESNEYIEQAEEEMKNIDEGYRDPYTDAYLFAQLAQTKAVQALTWAILALEGDAGNE